MITVQTSGSVNTFLLAVAFFFSKWKVPSGSGNFLTCSGNALCILFLTIDSGYSRHMTRNMSYLTDYKEIDGGYVTFGGNPKGGKIIRKRSIDHLGKFDGKADEDFFVGYSLNSKALRVFNSITRILEENLHIRFSESTLNVVGSRPDWIFDIDALTRTINYEQIVTCTQSNGFASTKANPKSSHDDGSKPSSDDGKKVDEDPRKENECNDQEKEDNVNSTNNVNTVSSIVNTAGTNEVNVIGKNIRIELQFDLNMPALEYVSTFDCSKDDEDDGAVADMNNLDTTIQMSSMGELTFFLGLQVKKKKDGIFISQDKYVAKILKKFEFTEVKTASTSMETQKPMLKDEDSKEVDVHMYRSMIGSLMYLTSSRPDIMFVVCAYARYQAFGIQKILLLILVAYTDSDYAGTSLDRKSTTGVLLVILNTTELLLLVILTTVRKAQLHAKVDGKKIIITESSVRRYLRLADEEGIDCLANSTIFEQIALTGKPTRKDTQVPHPIGPTKSIADEAVHKELGDRLVRATTTASSLEAECQETIGDTVAQTRFEKESNRSNDSLLDEIASLKRRVKKLEKKNRSRTHRLKRLYKAGLSTRVESSGDEESLGVDASKQESRIDAIDEVFVTGQNENIVEEVVDVAQVSTAATTVTITTEEITLAQALEALKTSKPKVKGIVFQEPEWDDIQAKIDVDHQLAERLKAQEQEDLSITEKATLFQQLLEKRRNHQHNLNRERKYFKTELVEGKEKRAGVELVQEITKKQKVEDDKEKADLK
nr:uncharacterized mitochondrial protein AtMg00810-like [Tanacetum cinerariifolium]